MPKLIYFSKIIVAYLLEIFILVPAMYYVIGYIFNEHLITLQKLFIGNDQVFSVLYFSAFLFFILLSINSISVLFLNKSFYEILVNPGYESDNRNKLKLMFKNTIRSLSISITSYLSFYVLIDIFLGDILRFEISIVRLVVLIIILSTLTISTVYIKAKKGYQANIYNTILNIQQKN